MLVVSRFEVLDGDAPAFLEQARAALAAFSARPGYVRGRVGRAADDPRAWVLTTEWVGVGAYRRSLGAYDVKVDAAPLLARSVDEPSAFEVLVADEAGEVSALHHSRRAVDAESVALGDASGPAASDV